MGVLQKINANFYEKSLHRIYLIMIKLQQGKYCAQIAKELGLKHQIVSYYIKKLERLGYLEHKIDSSIRLYGLTPLGRQFLALIKHSAVQKSSLRVKNIRVHRLVIKFKIIKDNPKAKFAKQISLNNWVKQ